MIGVPLNNANEFSRKIEGGLQLILVLLLLIQYEGVWWSGHGESNRIISR